MIEEAKQLREPNRRKLWKCNYCGYEWLSNKNPKNCPKCHNPVGKKPKMRKKEILLL